MKRSIYVFREPDRHTNYSSLKKAYKALREIGIVSFEEVKSEIKLNTCYILNNSDYQITKEILH